MKIKKHDNPDFEKLAQCASTSKTKPAFQVVYFDEEYAVASDGMRLFATKTLVLAEKGSYEIRPYAEEGTLTKAKTDFPAWRTLVHSDFKYKVGFTVPEFVEKLNPEQKPSRAPITFVVTGEIVDDKPVIRTELGISELGVGQYHYSVNLAQLKPFAGQTVQILLPSDNSKPMVITLSTSASTNPFDYDSFMIIARAKMTDSNWGITATQPV